MSEEVRHDGLRIEPLHDRHDRAGFRCGEPALDAYFATQAGQDMRKRVSTCFVLSNRDGAVIGFHTLVATGILLTDLPADLAKRLPRYPSVPATLMGRLAVGEAWHGKGFGQLLLMDAMKRALTSQIATWSFVVDAKNEAARRFYQAHGFLDLGDAGRRLHLPMATVARLFDRA